QMEKLGKFLLHDMNVIDYFLNHFVFPRHARQFEVKMCASGWDIPLVSSPKDELEDNLQMVPYSGPEPRPRPLTTGFSGTNDTRTLLPLPISQADLTSLTHTNAEVLTYLLAPRNRRYIKAAEVRTNK